MAQVNNVLNVVGLKSDPKCVKLCPQLIANDVECLSSTTCYGVALAYAQNKKGEWRYPC